MNALTKNESNAIGKMAETITTPKKNGKTVVMLSNEDTLKYVSNIVKGIHACNGATQVINENSLPFIKAGVKFCDTKEKSNPLFQYTSFVRTFFIDSFKGLINPKTNKPYTNLYVEKRVYPAFVKSVNSGKALENMHDSATSKTAGKKPSDKTQEQLNKDLIKALKIVWSLSDACSETLEYIESKQDDGSTLIEAITDYLTAQGEVLPE
jgi:hypothetical protein